MKSNAEIADALIEAARLNIGSPDAELLREAASRLHEIDREAEFAERVAAEYAPTEADFANGSAIETIGL